MFETRLTRYTTRIGPLLALLPLLLAAHATAQDGAPAIPPLAPIWQTSSPGQLLSTSATQGADGPVVAMAPDGSEMMVVYNFRVNGSTNRDPYYTLFDGQSWSTPAPIAISPGTDSAQLALTYSSDNTAHLLWEEPDEGLIYKRFEDGPSGRAWGPSQPIAATTLRLFGTAISATGSQTLDVVWAAKPDAMHNFNIYHARSTNGGDTWSMPAPIAETTPSSQAPKIDHDANGNPHVVWQEGTAGGGLEIRYVRGLPWTQPVVISPSWMSDARRPALTAVGNTLYLAFAQSQVVDADDTDQWAYFTRCSANCSSPANWSTPLNASGQPVRVNDSAPFDLIPEIARHDGCTYIFYHGYIEAVANNEVIWNVNSCDGWSGGGRDRVTAFNMRGIHPRVVMYQDDIHLVYEWVSGDDHQVYYMHGILPEGTSGPDGTYLPFVSKP